MALKRASDRQGTQQAADAVARFSHDAASPLMIVLSASEVLAEQPGLSDSQREDIREIRDAGQELHELIKRLHRQSREWTP